MFNQKKDSLFTVEKKSVATNNGFLNGLAKKSAKTKSGNGALKYSSIGSEWVDQFGKLGTYKEARNFDTISNDCSTLYALDRELFIKFTIYLRMISRKTHIYGLNIKTETAQSGAELKHESIMRMLWLHTKSKTLFWKNIGLFISAGSIKDIFVMLRYDLVYNGWEGRVLDWNRMGDLILNLLKDSNSENLVKKYLPQVKAKKNCTTVESQANTMIAKWLCNLLFGEKSGGSTYKKYRQLKNTGNAHTWQQLISQKKFSDLDFKSIHGRALNLLVKSKFLKNHNLQQAYSDWIGEQKSVKYTGYAHELLCELTSHRGDSNFVKTVDKQFVELVNKVKENDENNTKFIVVRDTSASMGSTATGTKFTCYDIGKALALYFSEFLTGTFANHWIEFNSDARLHQWKGSTASEKWYNDHSSYVGSTDLQSVINLFCNMKKKCINESDFPNGILCISDSEFNPTQCGKTNVEAALNKLRKAGFSKDYVDSFKIVLWNLQNSYYGRGSGEKFETFGNISNVFYMSGYSASNVKFILNQKVETAEDLFNEAMNQELLNLVSV